MGSGWRFFAGTVCEGAVTQALAEVGEVWL